MLEIIFENIFRFGSVMVAAWARAGWTVAYPLNPFALSTRSSDLRVVAHHHPLTLMSCPALSFHRAPAVETIYRVVSVQWAINGWNSTAERTTEVKLVIGCPTRHGCLRDAMDPKVAATSFDTTLLLVRMVTHIGGLASVPVFAMAYDRC